MSSTVKRKSTRKKRSVSPKLGKPAAAALPAKAGSAEPSGNSLVDHSAYWLHRLATAVLSTFESRLSELGVTTAQWKVMIVLAHRDATTPIAVANFVNVDAGSATRVIDRLVAKDLVSSVPSEADRRSVELSLTAKGHELMDKLLPIADLEDNRWLEGLSRGELMAFKQLLAKLLQTQGIEPPQQWLRTGLCTDPR